jgi:hypothetical protein
VFAGHYPDPHAAAFLQDAGVGVEVHMIVADEDGLLSENAEGRAPDDE